MCGNLPLSCGSLTAECLLMKHCFSGSCQRHQHSQIPLEASTTRAHQMGPGLESTTSTRPTLTPCKLHPRISTVQRLLDCQSPEQLQPIRASQIILSYMPTLRLYRICSRKSAKSTGCCGNTDSLSKVPDSLIYEKTTTNKHGLSDFFRE